MMVVTGDRDAYQLVDDGVRIMTTSRGITDTKVYDREGVIERYGIPPELIPDFIGLKGDTSDNIPGVPGIGDKTAAELLQRFGDLEGVLAHIDEISGAKRKQNLTEHADDARISKQLATIVRDVPTSTSTSRPSSRREPDRSQLRDGLPRLRAARSAAPARGGARGRRGGGVPRPRRPTRSRSDRACAAARQRPRAGCPASELALVAVRRPRSPRASCSRARPTWRFGAYAGGGSALAGRGRRPRPSSSRRPATGR